MFGDKKGEHRWQLGITDQHGFYHGLLEAIGQNDEYLRKYINAVRIYRDKHVAHIDKASSEGLSIPVLDIPKDSCIYLYNYLLEYEDDNKFFHDRPMISVEQFYQKHYDQANRIYHNSLLMVNSDIQ